MSNSKSSAFSARRRQRVLPVLRIESLESRQLLSAAAPALLPLVSPPLTGFYTPAQVRTPYGVSALSAANQGQGMTIGIVDEFDDANIVSDANAFSSEYNLPKLDGVGGDPTMTVFKDTALGSVTSAAGTGVGGETSLDVEWAHAMAPKANILLVEVPATGSNANAFNELLHGVQVAAQKGAESVSLSYGLSEAAIGGANCVNLNNVYLATGAAAGIAVTTSSGDSSTPLFPATSPNVLAVGGTSLYLGSVKGSYSFETAWGGLAGAGAGGGGVSSNFATPAYQSANGVNFGARSIPDVSMIADPVTGVSVYDSLDDAANPWTGFGGTSLASPIFAGIIALAQQNRVSASLPILNSVQIDTQIYNLYNSPNYSTYFHDIKLGSNKNVNNNGTTAVTGQAASAGYDLATGVGSPIANLLVPLLSTLSTPGSIPSFHLEDGVGVTTITTVNFGTFASPITIGTTPDSVDSDDAGPSTAPPASQLLSPVQQNPAGSSPLTVSLVQIGNAAPAGNQIVSSSVATSVASPVTVALVPTLSSF